MKESIAFHKGIRRVWSRLLAGSGTSRQDTFWNKIGSNSGAELSNAEFKIMFY